METRCSSALILFPRRPRRDHHCVTPLLYAKMDGLVRPIDTEEWQRELKDELLNPLRLVSSSSALHWERKRDAKSLMHVEPSFPTTTLEFVTRGLDGRVTGYREVTHRNAANRKTAKSSTDLTRKAGDSKGFIRGKSAYYPFRPGGLVSVDLEGQHDIEAIERAIDRKGSLPPFTRSSHAID